MKRREFIGTLPFVFGISLIPISAQPLRSAGHISHNELSMVSLRSILVDMLPKENLIANDEYKMLLSELFRRGIRTEDQLKCFVGDNMYYILDMERSLVNNTMLKTHLADYSGKSSDKVMTCLSHVGMIRSVMVNRCHLKNTLKGHREEPSHIFL